MTSPEAPARRRRSHPPSLLRLAERTLVEEALVGRGDRVLCACSGGPDSSALLHVLARLRDRLGYALVAHGVDHGLRPEARAELGLAEQLARSLDVPFSVTRIEVAPGGNLQARARAGRAAALRDAARAANATAIATGHTADDRAETWLLRLLRGAGPRGLAVLPSRSDAGPMPLVRPLLRARRADVLAHLARHRIPFAEDPSNRDPRFLRPRVRSEILPALEALSPGIVAHLCALADMLADVAPVDDPLAGLGRAQRLAVARARRLGRPSLRLRAAGGRELDVTFPRGETVIIRRG
jgi:tRNA(Ile)-lysidine synthase